MRTRWLLIVFAVAALMGIAFMVGVISYLGTSGRESGALSFFGKGKVAVIEVEGPIVSSDRTIEELTRARTDEGIAAAVLRIDSPGGSVGASQEILEAVRLLSKEKPVVASMGSVAASGGYYIAVGASKVLANAGTITGSIGVRLEHVMLGDLLKWARIQHETLKSGRLKDLGTFDRPMTAEERAILEAVLAELHHQFKQAVAEARGLTQEEIDAIADGRVYTGEQALNLKLVDALGGFAEAVRLAGELGGIKGEPELLRMGKRHKFFEMMMEGAAKAFQKIAAQGMDYWRPMMALSVE